MKIAFLGNGQLARAFGQKWSSKQEIFIAGRTPSKAKELPSEIGAAAGTMSQAVGFADVVVLATHNEGVFGAIEAAGGSAAFFCRHGIHAS